MSSPVPPVAYVQKGQEVDYTPVGAITAGDVVVLGAFIGIATHDIAAGIQGSLAVDGVFDMPKSTSGGSGFAAGAGIVYWDATNLVATLSDLGNTPIGYSIIACADLDTTVRVKLDFMPPDQKVVNLLTTNGAISPSKSAFYAITKAGIYAGTIAAPTAVTDDGKVLEITSDTANAHTLTFPAGVLKTGGAAATIATFTGTTGGGGIRLRAYNGTWKVMAQQGVAFS